MASAIFLRAVNVGVTNRCQPALIAKQLSKFNLVNIGAVGTFVARKDVSESSLRSAIAKLLPFKCEIMICSANEIISLARADPLAGERGENMIDAHVSVMAKRPAKTFRLPIYIPSKENWEIKIADIIGTAAISLRRRIPNGHLYPNAIAEREFGIAATTRNWNTIEKVAKILRND